MSVENLIKKANSRIGNVNPIIKKGAEEIIRRAYKQNLYVLFSDGYRSHAQQTALYAQGRTKKGSIVTNAKAGQSLHNYGLALDMFITNKTGTTASWNVTELTKAAKIAKSLGFEWGGDWTNFKDYPHIQMTGGLSLADLQAGKQPKLVLKGASKPNPVAKPKPKPTTKPEPVLATANYKTTSIVTFLQSIKHPFSFNDRKKLANAYGIGRGNYTGKANENNELLKRLKNDYKKTGKINNKVATKPIAKPKSTAKTYKVGQFVSIKNGATHFATGQTIAKFTKNKNYKIIQVKKDRVLLGGIMSWVYNKDLN